MHNYISQLYGFFISALKYQLRSGTGLFLGFVLPILFIFTFGYIEYSSIEYKIGYVKNSDIQYIQYINTVDNQSNFETEMDKTKNLKRKLEKSEIDAYIYLNPKTNVINVVTNINREDSGDIIVDQLKNINGNLSLSFTDQEAKFTINQKEFVGRTGRYIDFLLPGIVGFSLLVTAVAGTSYSFVSMKKSQALKRLFAAPTLKQPFILGHTLAISVIAVLQSLFMISIAILLTDYQIQENMIGIINITLLLIFSSIVFIGIGFVIAGISRDNDHVTPLLNLVILPQFLLGGTFVDLESMPTWLERISSLFPIYFFNEAMRSITLDGNMIYNISILENILGLLVWAILIYIIAIRVFNVTEN